VLTYDQPLPHRPQRLLIAGISGSGKTLLARRIERAWGLPHTELDALFHGPGWEPRATFMEDVMAFTTRPQWVTEWQYGVVRPVLAQRADTLVWLDYRFGLVLARLVRRSVWRAVRREQLWNGNVEPPLWTFFTDPEHVVRYAIASRRKYRDSMPEIERLYEHLQVVRLRSPRQTRWWLRHALRPIPHLRAVP
jgi:adenylate kinase family enzyme